MLNGHKTECPRCNKSLVELQLSYFDYVGMNQKERAQLVDTCQIPEELSKITTTYRMFKYSKAYKEKNSI